MKLNKILKFVVLSMFLQVHIVYSQSVTYEAEMMTKSGLYSGNITSPFNGLALYGNGDAGSTTAVLPTSSGQYTVTVIGASNNASSGTVNLEVDGIDVGSFSFAGTTTASASKTISFAGNATKVIKLVMKSDTGANDIFIDKIKFTYVGAVSAPRSAPVIPAVGAVTSGVYRNMFVEAGYNSDDVKLKIKNTFQQLFYGNDQTERVYYPVGDDEAYILDTGNGDVRSEGMSYGMMICVQLDKKAEFDKIWKWAYTHMRHNTGARKGYFAWQCSTAGAKMDANPASDGEEYFATALLFASKRWKNGTGIYNYSTEANNLLEIIQNKENPVVESITNLFNVKEKQVVFVPFASAALFTDPSYHVPAFYEVWATSANTNNAFWSEVATTSRAFFPKTANATTGLMPDYAKFNGAPENQGGHGDFRFDAWRCIMNIAVDYSWYKKNNNEKVIAQKIQTFFKSKGMSSYGNQYAIDGTVLSTSRSPGLIACNAVGSLASDSVLAWEFIDEFYATGIPSGQYRYYDGLLYFMSLLHVAGEFKAYIPGAVTPPIGTVPSTPSGLIASVVSSSQINLSWTDVATNETGFKIERAVGSGSYTQIATVGAGVIVYNDTALPANVYNYRVRATNATGDSSYSNVASGTTAAPATAPSIPSDLLVSVVSNSQINLSWTDTATNETGFKIERASGNGSYSQIATVGAGVVTYNNTALTANTLYNYRVRATNNIGDSGYSNIASGTTTPIGSTMRTYTVVAKGNEGTEQVQFQIDGVVKATWTLTPNYQNYTVSANRGTPRVLFFNDSGNRDVYVDYIKVDAKVYQSEAQLVNTSVFVNGQCGGSYSETMSCNGYIEYAVTGDPTPIPVTNSVVLKGSNLKYVSSENGLTDLICNRATVGLWEQFEYTDLGGGKVALKGNNGKYVSSENGIKNMRCDRSAIGDWEKFDLIDLGGGIVALKGNNGKYISSQNGTSGMNCSSASIGLNEKFFWETQINSAKATLKVEAASLVKSNSAPIVLYPNPVVGNLVFINGLTTTENYTISVYELGLGRIVMSQKVSNVQSCELPLRAITKSGVYIVTITSANENKVIKLIKN
ncbi:glycosyl hydrolase family 8 [Flavobacterium sp. PL002]